MIRWVCAGTSGILLLFGATQLFSQTVTIPSASVTQHVLIDPPRGSMEPGTSYVLVATDPSGTKYPAQGVPSVRPDGTVDAAHRQWLVSIAPAEKAESQRTFRWQQAATASSAPAFAFAKSDRSLKLSESTSSTGATRAIWQYNYGTIVEESLPETDSRRSRSCYVHPVWGMHGEVLSDDFPKDHYHHHGIFWTWPYVRVGDQTYDLWMSADIQQRFIRFLATDTGPVAAIMGVENGWFVGSQQVATERVWLRTFRSQEDCRAIDLTLVIQAGEKPVTLQGREQKSYGGLTFRFDVLPRTDATVRIPDRTLGYGAPETAGSPDLLNTPLPWADLVTLIPGAPQRSGAAVFIHPGHPDYPPTWLTRTYGALCVGWPGVKSFTIEPGKSIRLEYRIWIHGAELDPRQLAMQYRAYCDVAGKEG